MSWRDSFDKTKMVTDSFLEIRELVRKENEIDWHLKKVEGYVTALFEKFCPFKPGDRVKLTYTPEITEKLGWGWTGAKHYLVKGAAATVRDVDYRSDKNCFQYLLEFDNESRLDRDGNIIPVDRKSCFCFFEKDVERM